MYVEVNEKRLQISTTTILFCVAEWASECKTVHRRILCSELLAFGLKARVPERDNICSSTAAGSDLQFDINSNL